MSTPVDQQHERIRLGLLEYTMQHTVEDEYALVAERTESKTSRRVGLGAGVALLAFGLLIAMASGQTSRSAAADEADRGQLVKQIKESQQSLATRRASIVDLTAKNRALQAEFLAGTNASSGVGAKLRSLSLLTGATAVKGSGVRLHIADGKATPDGDGAVIDKDLQRVVNGLWQAGAEAIAINGQRLSPTSAIRHAGSAITVNYTSLSQPYVIDAIGDPDTLPSRFAQTTSGAAWLAVQRHFNMRFDFTTSEALRLPATDMVKLRSATARKG
jgi:uncharacterized protein YlxW (UPF0749 family)